MHVYKMSRCRLQWYVMCTTHTNSNVENAGIREIWFISRVQSLFLCLPRSTISTYTRWSIVICIQFPLHWKRISLCIWIQCKRTLVWLFRLKSLYIRRSSCVEGDWFIITSCQWRIQGRKSGHGRPSSLTIIDFVPLQQKNKRDTPGYIKLASLAKCLDPTTRCGPLVKCLDPPLLHVVFYSFNSDSFFPLFLNRSILFHIKIIWLITKPTKEIL